MEEVEVEVEVEVKVMGLDMAQEVVPVMVAQVEDMVVEKEGVGEVGEVMKVLVLDMDPDMVRE